MKAGFALELTCRSHGHVLARKASTSGRRRGPVAFVAGAAVRRVQDEVPPSFRSLTAHNNVAP